MLSKRIHQPSSFNLLWILSTSVWLMGTSDTHCKPLKTSNHQHVVATRTVGNNNNNNNGAFAGICGNGLFGDDYNKIGGEPFRKQAIRDQSYGLKQNQQDLVPLIWSNELINVRLNIFYDVTMAKEFGDYMGGGGGDGDGAKLVKFVRNLIYETQLIFEQPEIYPYVKVNLHVVNLIKSRANFHPNFDVDELLVAFSESVDGRVFNLADLNILLTYNNLWKRLDAKLPPRKILGVARQGTFCNDTSIGGNTLLLSARAINAAITLAHEVAHALDSDHDGPEGDSGRDCDPEGFIMSPTNGPKKLRWSRCSVRAMMMYLNNATSCVFNPQRMANSGLLGGYFNFTNADNRKSLPGMEYNLDDQCALALDSTASSALNLELANGNNLYETCQDLVCTFGSHMQVSLGPAVTGSKCSVGARQVVFGSCFQGSCKATNNI